MPIIYLSPSTQEKNMYVTGSGSEEYWMNRLADAMIPYLNSCGIRYKRNTPDMTAGEVRGDYELETGNVIVRTFSERGLNPMHTPGVLVKNHGPFSWGATPAEAVHNAVVMEQVARMAFVARMVNPDLTMNPLLIEKHFSRKHGPGAYYGQKK